MQEGTDAPITAPLQSVLVRAGPGRQLLPALLHPPGLLLRGPGPDEAGRVELVAFVADRAELDHLRAGAQALLSWREKGGGGLGTVTDQRSVRVPITECADKLGTSSHCNCKFAI